MVFRTRSIQRIILRCSIREIILLILLWCFTIALYVSSLPPASSCVITDYTEGLNERHPKCFLHRYCLKYKIQPAGLCDDNISVSLFIFIYSLPANVKGRQMIRQTWLDPSLFGGEVVQHVFLLGQCLSSNRADVLEEARIYNDIVVIDMRESFCSLTLKGIVGLHFASSFCPNAKFVLKTDDDMFVNMFLLQSTLSAMVANKQTESIIMGHIWYHARVFRTGRYAVSRLQYPGKTYPPFCSGSGFIMSMDVTKTLYQLAMQDPSGVLLHLDDPYITGVLADRAKLTHIQLHGSYLVSRTDYTDYLDEDLNRYLFLHIHDVDTVDVSPQQHLDLWQRLVKRQVRNPAPPIMAASGRPVWHVGMILELLPDWILWYMWTGEERFKSNIDH